MSEFTHDPASQAVLQNHSNGTAGFQERRASPRFPYRVEQRLAPIRDGKTPSPDQFQSIHCNDISLGGLSFYSSWSPSFETAVVELGTPPGVKYLKIKIVGSVLVDLQLPQYIVRCQFIGRVEY